MASTEKQNNTSFLDSEIKDKLERIINSHKPDTEEQLIVVAVHCVLVQNEFKFVCIGSHDCQEETPQGLTAASTDKLDGSKLPERWKQLDPDCYEFTYENVNNKCFYTFRALLIGDKLCFNLLQCGEHQAKAAELQLVTLDHVERKQKPVTIEWVVDPGYLWKTIERGLLGKHKDLLERRDFELHMKAMEQQRPEPTQRSSRAALIEGVPALPTTLHESPRFPMPSPFAYGDADRLPGHPGMGGMVMDPFRSGGVELRPPSYPGLPRGSIPPGARFDPFGPLTEFDYTSGNRAPRGSFEPNPDHLRRPGFDDDMFM